MLFALFAGSTAFAAEFGPALEGEILATDAAPVEDTASANVGCSDQYLHDGVNLPDLPLFYVRAQPDHSWGSQEMVDLIVDAGRYMSWLMPQASRFVIGDISRERGGYLAGHVSHRGGVDADIGIYKKGGWQSERGFTQLAPSELDLEANWAMINMMLSTDKVDFILLDRSLINRLKGYVLSAGLLTEEEAARIFPIEGSRATWENTGILRHAPHHQDHIHVRVLCSDGSRAGG